MTNQDKEPNDKASSPINDEQAENNGGDLESKVKSLEKKLEEAHDQRLQALAELENLRKRMMREKEETHKYATTRLLTEVLGIVDNLERSLANIPEEKREEGIMKTLFEGIVLVHKDVEQMLGRQGVVKVKSLGQPFDPNYHQAVSEVEAKDVPSGHIAQVLQEGYHVHERLLRPAMVSIAQSSPKSENN
jgi:molecular chaperone GrpE